MGQRILQDVDQMMDELSDVRQVPQGTLRIISSFGFVSAGGRRRRCRRCLPLSAAGDPV